MIRDVEQPTSDFFLRVKQEVKSPTLALFEADGGKWKIDAIANTRAFLAACLARASGIEKILNRPISAHTHGMLSLLASLRILVSRLESRSRQGREVPFGQPLPEFLHHTQNNPSTSS